MRAQCYRWQSAGQRRLASQNKVVLMTEQERTRLIRQMAKADKRRRKAKLLWQRIEDEAMIDKRTRRNWELGRHKPNPRTWAAFVAALERLAPQ